MVEKKVPPARIERTTPGLGIPCSIQLSYGGTRAAHCPKSAPTPTLPNVTNLSSPNPQSPFPIHHSPFTIHNSQFAGASARVRLTAAGA